MFSAVVGVCFQNCWSRSQSRFFKTAGVGVSFFFFFFNCMSRSQESEHLLQLPTPVSYLILMLYEGK